MRNSMEAEPSILSVGAGKFSIPNGLNKAQTNYYSNDLTTHPNQISNQFQYISDDMDTTLVKNETSNTPLTSNKDNTTLPPISIHDASPNILQFWDLFGWA